MLDGIYRGIARAAGVEVPGHVRIVERVPPRTSALRRLATAFERWNVRRSTYMTLRQLDDRTLKDIGLSRGMLLSVANQIAGRAVADDNAIPVRLPVLAANDNEPSVSADCA